MRTTCFGHPNHPIPNTLPDLEGSANLSPVPAPRKAPNRPEFGPLQPPVSPPRRPLPAGRAGVLSPPRNGRGAGAANPGHPHPAPQLCRPAYGVAGGVFFGSMRMIQSPFSMSLT